MSVRGFPRSRTGASLMSRRTAVPTQNHAGDTGVERGSEGARELVPYPPSTGDESHPSRGRENVLDDAPGCHSVKGNWAGRLFSYLHFIIGTFLPPPNLPENGGGVGG